MDRLYVYCFSFLIAINVRTINKNNKLTLLMIANILIPYAQISCCLAHATQVTGTTNVQNNTAKTETIMLIILFLCVLIAKTIFNDAKTNVSIAKINIEIRLLQQKL